MQIPNDICSTPRITAIFILNELKNDSSLGLTYHLGSKPKGYTQSSFYLTSLVEPGTFS